MREGAAQLILAAALVFPSYPAWATQDQREHFADKASSAISSTPHGCVCLDEHLPIAVVSVTSARCRSASCEPALFIPAA